MDQPKIESILRLITLLIGNRKSTNELAVMLGCDLRTLQRYLNTLKCTGFVVEYHSRGIPFLSANDNRLKMISELVHFSEEEAYVLHKAIDSIDDNSMLKQNLKKKLYNIYNYPWLADVIVNPAQGNNVHALIEAIEEKRTVVLKNYRSSNSNSVTDRVLEPYKFTTNYQQVWCYEVASRSSKLFKVARIGTVELLKAPWEYEKQHKETYIDVFRISGINWIGKAELTLNIRAYNLLVEEYPLAEQYVNCQNHNSFILSVPLCSYEGVGRFILGLYPDIQILGDTNLKIFIQEKIAALKKVRDNN
jgi:predicted DNA-binding transcriptional regulator YafY